MAPLLNNKNPTAKSVFSPSALLREARRQKGLATANIPSICVLDPDGDIVRRLKATGKARLANDWPCYHTELYTFTLGAQLVGIVGCAVGAPFAVLIAEELFASDCRLLISITSAGQITLSGKPSYFVVIDRALRDEGTSYHYAEQHQPSCFGLEEERGERWKGSGAAGPAINEVKSSLYPLLAQSRHGLPQCTCPLSRVERT